LKTRVRQLERTQDIIACTAKNRLDEIKRLREEMPEVECPSCGGVIRARMAE
jgi:predicted RNA-binding Zn-ribbon protein involved in translation (DUF1610 family)